MHKKEIKYHTKSCSICKKEFVTKYIRQNVCSFTCKREKARQTANRLNREKRSGRKGNIPCLVCGFKETIDLHHEGDSTYYLCPNHHALITRGIKTIECYKLG